ncbi:hypothetical protein EUTSA_v10015284mg, partial [Eutrema salsugineum]
TMRKLIESLKEVNENLEELLKEKETPKKEVVSRYPCCYESQDSKAPNKAVLFVKGFDNSLDRDDIKSALIKHFGSCGEITWVFVPFECATGVPKEFAFIDVEDKKKALSLSGSYMGGRKLEVIMARRMIEYVGKNMSGCLRCRQADMKACAYRFYSKRP